MTKRWKWEFCDITFESAAAAKRYRMARISAISWYGKLLRVDA